MLHYIPENLDIDKILHEIPPVNIERFSKEKLLYIIHLINAIPANNKDLEINDGFVPIYSQAVRLIVANYKQYFDYLIKASVLETDNYYIKGQKSKGYRFTELYQTDLKTITVNHLGNRKTFANNKKKMILLEKSHGFLIKWFNPNLKIDYALAMDFIHTYKQARLKELKGDVNNFKAENVKVQRQFSSSYINIERIAACEFVLSISPTVHRFHSNLTYLRSMLRNCLSYNGEELIAIDIKNCQPYLSSVLIKPTFWDKASINGLNVHLFKRSGFYNKLSIDKIHSFLLNQDDEITRVKDYIELVTDGQFYEHFARLVEARTGHTFSNRKQIKAAIFQAMFTSNKYLGQRNAAPKRLFKELFPFVYELFALIKQEEKESLPILLQRIESKLIIEIVSKRIGKEKRTVPIFTIHDSIATTKGNECYVKTVLEEEFFKAIGYTPTLNMHLWQPALLNYHNHEPDMQEALKELCM